MEPRQQDGVGSRARGKRLLNFGRIKIQLKKAFMLGHGYQHSHGHCHHHSHNGRCNGNSEANDSSTPEGEIDIEKSLHVVDITLRIDDNEHLGCCGDNMRGDVGTIKGVYEQSVKFDSTDSKLELSFDSTITELEHVVQEVRRVTGVKCVQIKTDEETLDILASGDVAIRIASMEVEGVSGALPMSSKVLRLSYDPATVGARTLLRRIGLHIKDPPPHNDPAAFDKKKAMYEKLWKTLMCAAFTIPVAVLAWADANVNEKAKALISLILATLVQMIAVPAFYRPAIKSLFRGRVEMDLLVVISITAAYAYSVVAFGFRMADKPLEMKEFFETSTLLITLVLLGRLVSAYAQMRANAAVSFRSLQATNAIIIESGEEREIDARLLQYGDIFKVRPDTIVPTDGKVVSGLSEVNESMLTGESAPVTKQTGSTVSAGTLNINGTLTIELTRLPGRNTVTDIVKLVEKARDKKPNLQTYADKVASWFVPVVGFIALICFIVWVLVGIQGRKQSPAKAVPSAITYAVATLAVSCPCALGLAVPMVVVIAGGIAAKKGVVIKSGEVTERARKVTDVVLDKTGTITESRLSVVEKVIVADDWHAALGICNALVSGNRHPVSDAVSKALESDNIAPSALSNVEVVPGSGIRATLGDDEVLAGNPRFTESETNDTVAKMIDSGLTVLVVTRASQLIVVFGLRPRVRSEAAKVIHELQGRHVTVHIVSGDEPRAVKSIAEELGISNFASQTSPAGKATYVEELRNRGRTVLFAGDGTNDAVAVKAADFGVQMGGGSEITKSAADVVLLSGLDGILVLLDISKMSFSRIVFNFAWSAVYNVLAILLASGAFVNVRIEPAYAGAGELAASFRQYQINFGTSTPGDCKNVRLSVRLHSVDRSSRLFKISNHIWS